MQYLDYDRTKIKWEGKSPVNKTFLIAPMTWESSLMIFNNKGDLLVKKDINGFPAQFTQLSDLTGYSYFAGNIHVGGKQNKIKKYRANGLYTIGKFYITDNNLETKKVVEYIPTNKIPNVIGLHMHGNYVLGDNHYLLQAISFEDVVIKNKKTSVVNCILQEQLNGEVIWEWQSIDYPELFEASFDRNNFFSAEVQNKEYVCDYAHMNSSIFTSDKKYLYISFKHIGIVKVDYLTKEIIWILGPKTADLLKFPKDFPIFANQHDLHLIDDNTLYFWDNQHLSYAEISFVDDMVANYKTFKCSDTWSVAVMGNAIKASDNILDVCFGMRRPYFFTLYDLPIVSEFDLQTGEKLLDLTINDRSLKLSNYMYQVQRGINIYEN